MTKAYLVQVDSNPLTFPVAGDGLWGAPAGQLTGRFVYIQGEGMEDSSLWFLFEGEYPGLVYTDTGFETAVEKHFEETWGLTGVHTSEQGEQGTNYVDFDMFNAGLWAGLNRLVSEGRFPDGTEYHEKGVW